jgi:Zn-dependent M32 family carboxypeptidase
MAKIYYRRIIAGEMTIEDVPERWKAEVQALLDELNIQ